MRDRRLGNKIAVCLVALTLAAFAPACLPMTVSPSASPQAPAPSPTLAPAATAATAAPSATVSAAVTQSAEQVVYKNTKYGFQLVLPKDWKGFSVVTDEWAGNDVKSGKKTESGPEVSIRNPKWTSAKPYQDIPILVLTLKQWDALQKEQFHIGAAPIGPSELGRNAAYVFALPARYNYAYPEGWKEVQDYLDKKPLQTFAPGSNG